MSPQPATTAQCSGTLTIHSAKRDLTRWIGAALGLVLLGTLGYAQRERFLPGQNDFVQLYAGARLSGTPNLYEPEASRKIHMEVLGVSIQSVYYSRLPFYAFLLRPLGTLNYLTAYWLFQALSFAAFLWFLWIRGPRCPELLLFSSLCLPVLSNFLNGQDLAFALLSFALAIEAMRRGNDFAAGAIMALCATKIHLFALVPLVLLINRQWRVLAGGVASGAGLAVLSFLADGGDWPKRYLSLLSNPDLHPSPEHMPTLRGLIFAATGGESNALLFTLSAAVLVMFVWIAWSSDLELGLAFALVGGLLIGYHAYLQDCMILLMTFVLVLEHSNWPPLRGTMALVIAPPVFLCLMAGRPWNAAVPAALLISMTVAAISAGVNPRKPAPCA